jgi:hypothetical protein
VTSDGGNRMSFSTVIGGAGGGPSASEMAAMPVTVAGDDLANVVIITSKGVAATGRVTFEGGSAPPSTTPVRVMATSTDSDAMSSATATVAADGSFELKGLLGRKIVRVGALPSGWLLKAVRAGGEDVTDSGVEFRPGSEAPALEIVLTSRLTDVVGSVAAPNGAALKDYTVVVFSTDPQHWTQPLARRVAGVRPNQEGRFQLRNLPPGSYYVAALDYIEQGAWGDPEILERLKVRASQFTLAEGGTETLSLKLLEQY